MYIVIQLRHGNANEINMLILTAEFSRMWTGRGEEEEEGRREGIKNVNEINFSFRSKSYCNSLMHFYKKHFDSCNRLQELLSRGNFQ